MTTTVVCVLKGGREFFADHVWRLESQVRAHSPVDTRFTCLTDRTADVGPAIARPLAHGWPGWWSKLEVFKLPGPCLYLDLDVNITGSLVPLLEAAAIHDFIALADFWVEGPHRLNSSVMGWSGDLSWLYREFADAPDAFMAAYKTRERWGDQRFIADCVAEVDRWQDVLPGKLCSYKRGALEGKFTADCRVLVSHGEPRPWAPDGADTWLAKRARWAAA
jgi:hypothetical protein